MSSFVMVDKSKCTGCRHCEYVCSYKHNQGFNMNRSRIQVIRDDTLKFRTLVCVNCKNPKCIEACPTNAIYRDENNVVRVDETKCTACKACINVCNRMFFDYVDNVAINCDLCGACISECPEGALKIKTIGE